MGKKNKAHLKLVVQIGCIACRKLGYPDTPAEIHHIRSGQGMSQRANDVDTLPLCPFHHRQGPDAIHVSPASFQRKFGTERALLMETLRLVDAIEASYV